MARGTWTWIPVAGALVALGAVGAAWLLHGREQRPPVTSAAPPAEDPLRASGRRPLFPEPQAAPKTEPREAPRSATSLRNDEAVRALEAGDVARAVELFESCVADEPTREVYASNLAEALVRLARAEEERGDVAHAVEHLGRAIELAPAREDVAVLGKILERWKRELELGEDDWTEGSSRFELSFDTDRADILHHSHEVLEVLERNYDYLRGWFQVEPFGSARVRVVLYDSKDFDRLTGLGDWAGGVFDGVVRVSVDDLLTGGEWRVVLLHELVHAFVNAIAGPKVPGWLNEGLAQMLEGRERDAHAVPIPLSRDSVFPLERLVGTLASWEDKAAIGRAYVQSLVFVGYLRTNYGDEALRRMLLGVAEGKTVEEAFQAWTQVALPVAFEDWRATLF